MVKKSSEMLKEIKEQMRGGKGSVEITHLFSQNELGGKSRLMAVIRINPGCSIGLHKHEDEEEIFYIIAGKGLVDDNGEMKEVCPGDAVLTGGGAVHAIENTGDEVLVMTAVILLYR